MNATLFPTSLSSVFGGPRPTLHLSAAISVSTIIFSLSPDHVGGEGWGEGAAPYPLQRLAGASGNAPTAVCFDFARVASYAQHERTGNDIVTPFSLSPDRVGGEGWGEGARRRTRGNAGPLAKATRRL